MLSQVTFCKLQTELGGRVGRAVFPVWRERESEAKDAVMPPSLMSGRSRLLGKDTWLSPAPQLPGTRVLASSSAGWEGKGGSDEQRVSADEQANNPNLLPLISKLEPKKH